MAKTTSADRFIFTLLISIIIHLIIVLGISFDVFSQPTNAPANNLEITLVKQKDNVKPEQADFLAQANNDGGGELDTPSPEPTPDAPVPLVEENPISEPIPVVAAAEIEPEPLPIDEPTPEPPAPEPVAPAPPKPEPKPVPPKPAETQPEKTVKKITQKEAERQVQTTETPDTAVEPETEAVDAPPPRPSARDLMLQARNELQETLDRTTKALSERPKKRRISASTKEFAAAAYMKAWEMKVERIGNMNYPQEARQKGLNGSLMLSVDINPDGSVPAGGIVISRSSGHTVLDEAAVRIVRLGAPYAAIPDDVLRDNDMLTIIRTWKFETGHGLSTR